jgi:hypothetical protein
MTRGERRSDSIVSAPVVSELKVRGSMSVAEAAQSAGLTAEELLNKLDLPASESPSERLGPLLHRHGKRLSDLNAVLNAEVVNQPRKH